MERLTSPMRGGFRAIRTDLSHEATYARISRLAEYEDLNLTPAELAASLTRLAEYDRMIESGEMVKVVRCGECKHWRDRQIRMKDGACRDYGPDDEQYVTIIKGINVESHCTLHGFEDSSGSWFWANKSDYCSRGERRETK